MKFKKWLLLAAIVVLLAIIAVIFFQSGRPQETTESSSSPGLTGNASASVSENETDEPLPTAPNTEGEPVLIDPADGLPGNALVITQERQAYQNNSLRLVIPKLSIDCAVWDGTTTEDLRHGACLYEYAQLPGEGDRNVSIAAHRNFQKNGVVSEALFYSINELTDNDYAYLVYQGTTYRYIYEKTTFVQPDDWSVIFTQGYSCLTLTSCDPIGVATSRIIVNFRLDATLADGDAQVFQASRLHSPRMDVPAL